MGRKAKGFWRRSGSKTWHTRDPFTGKRVSTYCLDLEAAQAWKRARERLAADPVEVAASEAQLGTWCDGLIAAKREAGRLVKFYEQKLKPWRDMLGDDYPLAGVTPVVFDEYARQRLANGVTRHTINKEINCAIQVCRLAKRAGCFGGDLQALRPMHLGRGYVPRTRVLSAAELGALLAELEPERGAFVALCVALGLRRSEAFGLDPGDVDLVVGVVRVRGTKTAGASREVPILAPFRGLVERAAGYLPLQPWQNYLRDIKSACRRVGIGHCSANDFRRTHATILRSAAVDRDVLRQLLGHTPGSKVLETVYDKPTARDLAARAGDLSTIGSQLGIDVLEKALRAREDSNFRPTAPESKLQLERIGVFLDGDCYLAATRPGEACRERAAKSTIGSQPCRPGRHSVFQRKSRAWFARGAAA